MKILLKQLLKVGQKQKRSPLPKPISGFTMIELLVATIMATIIIVPVLTFMVDLLNRDVREQAKTNTEKELQAAVDYIAQDMSQAFYVYDLNKEGKSTEEKTAIDNFIAELPHSNDNQRNPILVFWKRQFEENALDPSGGICENTTDPENTPCNDTFVHSLVAYYLIEDDNDTWCQPSGGICPKRIGRFQIEEGVTDTQGNYVCGDENDQGRSEECNTDPEKRNFQRDSGYSSYEKGNETNWTQAEEETYENSVQVLVNYIDDFDVDSVTNNNLAQITIVGNALRRSQNDFSCINNDDSPYCPKATAQVGARSGLGTSQ